MRATSLFWMKGTCDPSHSCAQHRAAVLRGIVAVPRPRADSSSAADRTEQKGPRRCSAIETVNIANRPLIPLCFTTRKVKAGAGKRAPGIRVVSGLMCSPSRAHRCHQRPSSQTPRTMLRSATCRYALNGVMYQFLDYRRIEGQWHFASCVLAHGRALKHMDDPNFGPQPDWESERMRLKIDLEHEPTGRIP